MLNELELNELESVTGGLKNNRRYLRIRITDKDTLSNFAAKYNVSVEFLQRLNHIENPNVIITGKDLLVPNPDYHE